jgi:hypothetical protein
VEYALGWESFKAAILDGKVRRKYNISGCDTTAHRLVRDVILPTPPHCHEFLREPPAAA